MFSVAFNIFALSKYFQIFLLSPVLLFLSRFCNKKKFLVSRFCFCQYMLSADFYHRLISLFVSRFYQQIFCHQQICFLSANVFTFTDVMEIKLTPAYAVSRQPASCRQSFSLRPARIFASITIPFVLPDLPAIDKWTTTQDWVMPC